MAPTNSYLRFEPEEIEQSIAMRFEQQARLWPTRVAVKTAGQELTYAELNRAANQLAHLLLQERGSGMEPVGLLLEHGAPMVTALLAVLKAGKFYVPLDPTYPLERLAYILDDAQAGIMLASDALIGVANDLAGPKVRVLSVDAVASSYSTANPGLTIAPEAFAYLLYTSGSVGKPKGVVESQRNVLHFTMVRTNSAHIAADDRLAMLLSFNFSGSATPLYCALLNGAALHLHYVKETGSADLARWLVAEQITVCIAGASIFRQLVSTLNGSERFPALRLFRVGSEPVYRRDVELFRKHFPASCLLLNSIGSTEMRNFAEYFIGCDTVIDEDLVPVGYAVEDTEILLIDDNGRPVGVGEIGEIVVKTRFIAPAYWRLPELTHATFQPDPNGGNERLYLTGDLGRRRADGALVHLGRKDFQVKIRGYRIEIGEIENALLALAGVSAAVVVARESEAGDRHLVAYMVLSGGIGPQIGAWRAALAAKLADYMIPASFVVLESLPRTSTGKVDRAKLPQPDRARPVLDNPYVVPSSQLENVLATLWAKLLELDRVGIHDDFYALGGDSLRGARLLTSVKAVFGVDLPFQLLFNDAATVAGMARAIEDVRARAARSPQESKGSSASKSAVIPRRPHREPAALSGTQRRMWLLAKLDPDSPAYNQGSAHRLLGQIDIEALRRALGFLIQRHEILRTGFALIEDEPRQVVRATAVIDLRTVDLGAMPAAQHEQAMQCALLAEERKPFDLESGPLLRCVIVRLAEREHVLLRVWHHIVSDGWSAGVFERELSIAYGAYASGDEPALPELPIQYADYAVWQREWLQGEVLDQQLGHWKSKLAGLATLELPTDRPRPPV
ncbi:MAG TPA: amino acid adenylation domain-containing protein, partial [Burkholderiales bacterium]|nr:amino acid adenylation domain-containing protein [Burkholderiales bacterium]